MNDKHKLKFTSGTAFKVDKHKQIAVTEQPLQECGCQINCCYGFIELPDYKSISGDIVPSALYIVDGVPKVRPIATAIAEINGYKANTIVAAASVSISGCIVGNLAVAATRQLTATVLPIGSLQTGTWVSSVPARATVSGTGLVTGVSAGTTVITFTSTDGAFTATCSVTVA